MQVVSCQDEHIWVRMGSRSGCTACDNGHGCGAGLFAKLLRGKPVILKLKRNDLLAEPGQMLRLAVPEQIYLKLVFRSYGWPLLAALAGAWSGFGLGSWLQFGPLLIDVSTLLGGLLAGVLVMRLNKSQEMTDTILNSLNTTVYFSSATPNMCNSSLERPEQF